MAILLLEKIHPDAIALLREADVTVRLAETPPELHAVLNAEKVSAIITHGRGQIPRELMDHCPTLAVVARCGVEVDNIDIEAAMERDIAVIHAPGSTTHAVAEQTLMLMLALSRQLLTTANAMKAGDWYVRNRFTGDDLRGKTLGVVGMGAIGQRVAALAEAFGMQVVYWSRSVALDQYVSLPLPELLSRADIVSLHAALTQDTYHLIGEEELGLMKRSALLINTAHGSLIDQEALVTALKRGRPAGFAADVLEQEPPEPDDPLLLGDRVLITPRTATLTESTYRALCVRTVRNVLAVLRDEEPEEESVFVPA
jgi:phosphoglycerate dehydrogenase-like enzyme